MFRKYYEMGYSPIPVYFGGKNPSINNWQKFCEEKPTEQQIDYWDTQKLNIGIACGPASGIIVVDIDTDDKELLNKLPPSPVRRRGKVGEARFFKYTPLVTSTSIPRLDILSTGRQIIVPPSIHPDTKRPYEWLTPDTLENTKAEDLPEITPEMLSGVISVLSSVKIDGVGRNNKLVQMVSAMRSRGEPEQKIVKDIYDWDMLYHNPRLFTDKKEGMGASNESEALNNAWGFVVNVTKSLISKGIAVMDSEQPLVILVDDEGQTTAPVFKEREYPEPQGLIKDVQDLITQFSERDMPNIALGGAIALMSAVCSNRYRLKNTWSNTYVLNLAPTGAGKSFPQTIVKKILAEQTDSNLLGYGNYKSGAAFTKNLKSRRERLDIIDEISSLFAQIKDGGLYQTEMLEELCKVWSESSGKFMAAEYAEREDTSSCYNPCVNILGSSTIEGIKTQIDKSMLVKGLIPRFLIFSHSEYGKKKESVLNREMLVHIGMQVNKILEVKKNEVLGLKIDMREGPVYNPIDVYPSDSDAIEFMHTIDQNYADAIENEQSESIKCMLTRGKEQVYKLATIHAVGCQRQKAVIADFVWAKKVFETSLHNASLFIEESSVDNEFERDCKKILNYMSTKGSNHITSVADLLNRLRGIDNRKLQTLLDTLVIRDAIRKAERIGKNGKKKSGFVLSTT